VDTVAAMHSKNIPVVVIAPGGEYVSPALSHLSGLAVPLNSTVRQAKDLNGKVVGVVSLHGLTQTAASVWIDQNGGDLSTIKFVEVPFPSMAAALANNRVDAVSAADPFMDDVAKVGRFLSYGLDGIGKRFIIASWFATPQWTKDHPDLTGRFVAAMHDTAIWANRNPAKTVAILAKHTNMDPAIVAKLTRTHFAEQMTPELLQPLMDAAAKYNGFKAFPSQDVMVAPAR
jgi:NitT/TauT family transport system substrate-binding protein